MEQILLHEHRAKKEGITLVETLVAIAVVVIVSVAAASVAFYSSNAIRNATVKRFFHNEIDTIAKLYLTYDGSEFSDAMNNFCGVNQSPAEGETLYFYNGIFEMVDSSAPYEYKLSLAFASSSLNLASSYKDGSSIYAREVSK